MKVKSLIKQLQKFDPELEVIAGRTILVSMDGTEQNVIPGKLIIDPSTLFPVDATMVIVAQHPQPKSFLAIGFSPETPINRIQPTFEELMTEPDPEEIDTSDIVH